MISLEKLIFFKENTVSKKHTLKIPEFKSQGQIGSLGHFRCCQKSLLQNDVPITPQVSLRLVSRSLTFDRRVRSRRVRRMGMTCALVSGQSFLVFLTLPFLNRQAVGLRTITDRWRLSR
jgi:hypothetical protein